jgi:hypothetical protein
MVHREGGLREQRSCDLAMSHGRAPMALGTAPVSTTSLATTMSLLRILGYADSKPAVFVVDRASPHSQVSAAFLYHNSLNTTLNSNGHNEAYLTISVPSQGGYYKSSRLRLNSSVSCTVDIVLGADWLALCRVSAGTDALQHPAPESVQRLPDGHGWTTDGVTAFTLHVLDA